MIHVKRIPVPSSLDLTVATSDGALELGRAKKHMQDKNLPLPAENFKAYGGADVRDALKAMFHNKCAYCESQVAGSSQTDVEHYRPKAKISDKKDHPGYWWLAMDWSNLVLSCMHCNQTRKQLLLSPDMTEAQILKAVTDNKPTTVGKLDKFPTEDDIWITDPAQLAAERPLLLDPTVSNPEPLLAWGSRQNFALISARNGDRRAEATIRILGLNRRHLCEERMTKLATLTIIMQDIRTALAELAAAATDPEAEAIKRAILRNLRQLAEQGHASKPHAALARDFLAQAKALIAQTIS